MIFGDPIACSTVKHDISICRYPLVERSNRFSHYTSTCFSVKPEIKSDLYLRNLVGLVMVSQESSLSGRRTWLFVKQAMRLGALYSSGRSS